MIYRCWPFTEVAPLPGAPRGSFLLELLGGHGCFSEIQGAFWRRREDAVRGGHRQPFQDVSQMLVFSLQSSPCFFQLAFPARLQRPCILYFRGMGWGGGNGNFFFLLQLSCKSLDFYIYFQGSLCAITLIRPCSPPLCYSAHIP